ncbi:cold shock domain-containing protein [Roseococcus microcysteis]|uniref:cold shock domain-containing protein n=1 Tax=Roseococcus microcysteis TaxID=2771361 RepID=UPI001CC33E24|nr:cold shock domain-containing protein [Roseococcus microcysteis]
MSDDYSPDGGEGGLIEAKVKWYNGRKGFGFVLGPDGQDVFFHASALTDANVDQPDTDDILVCEIGSDRQGRRLVTRITELKRGPGGGAGGGAPRGGFGDRPPRRDFGDRPPGVTSAAPVAALAAAVASVTVPPGAISAPPAASAIVPPGVNSAAAAVVSAEAVAASAARAAAALAAAVVASVAAATVAPGATSTRAAAPSIR